MLCVRGPQYTARTPFILWSCCSFLKCWAFLLRKFQLSPFSLNGCHNLRTPSTIAGWQTQKPMEKKDLLRGAGTQSANKQPKLHCTQAQLGCFKWRQPPLSWPIAVAEKSDSLSFASFPPLPTTQKVCRGKGRSTPDTESAFPNWLGRHIMRDALQGRDHEFSFAKIPHLELNFNLDNTTARTWGRMPGI